MVNKIKKFLRDIFAPRVTIHQYGNMTQKQMNDMQKPFKKMDEAFKEMDKVFEKFKDL
jgi:uncharacterized coiled-coil DUF342 family protein